MKTNKNFGSGLSGFSLVEMLVVLGVGSLFLFGVYQMFFFQQKQVFFHGELVKGNENLNLGAQVLYKAVVGAGEGGCLGVPEGVNHTGVDLKIVDGYAVYGFFADDYGWTPSLPLALEGKVAAGSDVVVVEKGSYARANVLLEMVAVFDPVFVSGEGFSAGDLVLIGDCRSADLFLVDAITSVEGGQFLFHKGLSRLYGVGAQVMRWEVDAFYLAHSNASSGLALFQKSLWKDAAAVELVSGMEVFKIEYALSSFNGAQFLTADLVQDWRSVVGVALNLQTQHAAISRQFNVVLYNAL